MAKLKLGAIEDDKPVKFGIEFASATVAVQAVGGPSMDLAAAAAAASTPATRPS